MPIYQISVKEVMRIFPEMSYYQARMHLQGIKDCLGHEKKKGKKIKVTLNQFLKYSELESEDKEMIISIITNKF